MDVGMDVGAVGADVGTTVGEMDALVGWLVGVPVGPVLCVRRRGEKEIGMIIRPREGDKGRDATSSSSYLSGGGTMGANTKAYYDHLFFAILSSLLFFLLTCSGSY